MEKSQSAIPSSSLFFGAEKYEGEGMGGGIRLFAVCHGESHGNRTASGLQDLTRLRRVI